MTERWPSAQEWLDGLDDETRVKADAMIALLNRFGCEYPIGWVRSELRENIPQTAKFLFLREARSLLLNETGSFQVPGEPEFETHLPPLERLRVGDEAFQRLAASGADIRDVVRVARAATCLTLMGFVEFLDGTHASETYDLDGVPNWAVMETISEAGEHKLTGRHLDSLHESLFSLYKTDE